MPPKKKPRKYTKNLYDNFQQGDLVFGLNSFLKPVHTELAKKGFKHTYCNSLNGSVVSDVVLEHPPAKKLDRAQKKHYQFLHKHKDFLQREGGKPIVPSSFQDNISAAFRRACKLLLINRDVERNYMAHLVLGEIDWSLVCDKTNQGVTNSELRAVYRDVSLHGKHPNILFYNKELELTDTPPWEEENTKKIFADYEEARQKKRSRTTNPSTETEITAPETNPSLY